MKLGQVEILEMMYRGSLPLTVGVELMDAVESGRTPAVGQMAGTGFPGGVPGRFGGW